MAIPLTDERRKSIEKRTTEGHCLFGPETVADLLAEIDRLKPAADAMAWLDASRPLISTTCNGWAVLPRKTSVAHLAATLAEAVAKAMDAEKQGGTDA